MTRAAELKGQVGRVTGGSGGTGSAIIGALAAPGARAVSLNLVAPGAEGIPRVKCEVREDSSAAAALQRVFQRPNRPDMVIPAAGLSRDGVVLKMPVEDWDFIPAVNLRGELR